MKQTLLLITTAMLLVACNFTILGENDDEVVLEKRDLKIVERNITIEELSGKWVIEDESIERNAKLNSRYLNKDELNLLKQELRSSYINIFKNNTAEFLDDCKGCKIHKGRTNLGYVPTLWRSNITKDDYRITIMYRVKDNYNVEYSEGKDLYFLKLNNKFYLGKKYYRGEEETGSKKTYYLLYKKVKSIEVEHESN